jgi:hypothetical protein
MKYLLLLPSLLTIGCFAQGPNANIQANPLEQIQMQNINDDEQAINFINVQTNFSNQQQANPPQQAQGPVTRGSFFGSENNNEKPCTDCDEVKRVVAASRSSSSGGGHTKRSFSANGWSKTIEGKVHMKMRRTFARQYKPKTSYALCFNWH